MSCVAWHGHQERKSYKVNFSMIRAFCASAIASAAFVASAASSDVAIVVRPISEARVWQTVLKPSEPLEWPWVNGADAAVVTVTNHCTGGVSVSRVERGEEESYGEFGMVRPALPDEQLYSVVLEQMSGETVLSRDYARLAYVPGVEGGGVCVRSTRAMRRSEEVAVFAWDSAWQTNEVESASFAWADEGSSGEEPLPATSGWSSLRLVPIKETLLSLSFDDEVEWTASVYFRLPFALKIY